MQQDLHRSKGVEMGQICYLLLAWEAGDFHLCPPATRADVYEDNNQARSCR